MRPVSFQEEEGTPKGTGWPWGTGEGRGLGGPGGGAPPGLSSALLPGKLSSLPVKWGACSLRHGDRREPGLGGWPCSEWAWTGAAVSSPDPSAPQ